MMSGGKDTRDGPNRSNARVEIIFVRHEADARSGSVPAVMDAAGSFARIVFDESPGALPVCLVVSKLHSERL